MDANHLRGGEPGHTGAERQQKSGAELPHVIVRVGAQLFGLSSADVIEMVSLTQIAALPQVPDFVRGTLILREQVLPVVDLRMRLGMPSALSELQHLLEHFEAREADHRRWIEELDSAIHERRPFRLATDPHKCAFGRWYDSLVTDNVVLASQLKKIDGPHQRIHHRGAEALALVARGEHDRAMAIAREIREHDLAGTLALFAETRAALRQGHREIAVVINATPRYALAVDAVESVEGLIEGKGDLQALVSRSTNGCVSVVRKRVRTEQIVMQLDPSRLLAA